MCLSLFVLVCAFFVGVGVVVVVVSGWKCLVLFVWVFLRLFYLLVFSFLCCWVFFVVAVFVLFICTAVLQSVGKNISLSVHQDVSK